MVTVAAAATAAVTAAAASWAVKSTAVVTGAGTAAAVVTYKMQISDVLFTHIICFNSPLDELAERLPSLALADCLLLG